MAKAQSRTKRWADAADRLSKALDDMEVVAQEFSDALYDLQAIQEEYSEWRDNLPENLATSALAEKLDALKELNLDVEVDLSELQEAVGAATDAELPLGFGRD